MREVKFKKGNQKLHSVSLKEFAEVTKEQYPYSRINDGHKVAYAICPLCENPVRLLGIYGVLKKQRPHARHCKYNVKDIAEFEFEKYINCPHHMKNANYVTDTVSPREIQPINMEILELARKYFDKCIYILQRTMGLKISEALAIQIARDYMAHPGYMVRGANRENVPYIMGRCMRGVGVVERIIIEDGPLFEMLKDKKEITLVKLPSNANETVYRVESNVGYLDLSLNISQYRFVSDPTDGLQEYIKIHIGIGDGNGTYKTYAEKEMKIDPFIFNKLINRRNNFNPRAQLQKIAEEILVI